MGGGHRLLGQKMRASRRTSCPATAKKESIVLDLKSDDGKATLTRLIGACDGLVENFGPVCSTASGSQQIGFAS